jgi:hypothetical protein
MNGLLSDGQTKRRKTRSIYCHKHAKAKPPINRTRYKKISLDDVKHVMEFLKQHASLRKSLPEHYFTSLLKIYQMKIWSCYVDYWQQKLENPKEDYTCNSRQASMGPTTRMKQNLPTACESMDRLDCHQSHENCG